MQSWCSAIYTQLEWKGPINVNEASYLSWHGLFEAFCNTLCKFGLCCSPLLSVALQGGVGVWMQYQAHSSNSFFVSRHAGISCMLLFRWAEVQLGQCVPMHV
jgi:hypothetical protein